MSVKRSASDTDTAAAEPPSRRRRSGNLLAGGSDAGLATWALLPGEDTFFFIGGGDAYECVLPAPSSTVINYCR